MKNAKPVAQFNSSDLVAAMEIAPVTVIAKPAKAGKNKSKPVAKLGPIVDPIVAPVAPQAVTVAPDVKPTINKVEQAKQAKIAAEKERNSSLQGLNFYVSVRPEDINSILFAFTQAWLELTNVMNGAAVNKKALEQVIGTSAVSYHKRKGNFEQDGYNLVLTAKGLNHFSYRIMAGKVQEKDVDAWKQILGQGKPDGNIIKSPAVIFPITK